MFDVKILEGNRDFLIYGSKNIAITQQKARQLFGDESPIGNTVKIQNDELTISTIVSGMSKRSNYAFDIRVLRKIVFRIFVPCFTKI
jgi:hypothetical protein